MTSKYRSMSEDRILERVLCPLTGEVLIITHGYYAKVLELYPEFLDVLFAEFNTGEPDCNIILRKTIIRFFEKYPEYKNKYFTYMVLIHVTSIMRCGTVCYRPEVVFFYYTLAKKPFLTAQAYQDAPPDFKVFLAQLRRPAVQDKYRAAVFVHNCALIANRLDNFEFALDEDTIHGEVALPYHSYKWTVSWLIYIVRQLLNEGLLVLNPEAGPLKINDYTQELINAQREGRDLDFPSPFGIGNEDKEDRNNN